MFTAKVFNGCLAHVYIGTCLKIYFHIAEFYCPALICACVTISITHHTKKIYPIFFHFSLLYNIFVSAKTNHLNLLMKPDPRALKASLLRRELELQRLIRQMKFDQLHNSPVYKNLEKELVTVKAQLNLTES